MCYLKNAFRTHSHVPRVRLGVNHLINAAEKLSTIFKIICSKLFHEMQLECCLGAVNTIFLIFSHFVRLLRANELSSATAPAICTSTWRIKRNISFAVYILHRRLPLEHAISLFADDVTEEIRRAKIFFKSRVRRFFQTNSNWQMETVLRVHQLGTNAMMNGPIKLPF